MPIRANQLLKMLVSLNVPAVAIHVQPNPFLHWSYRELLAFHVMYTVQNQHHNIFLNLARPEPVEKAI